MNAPHHRSLKPSTLFEPERNCWRVERAERVALLVDADNYFSTFAKAAMRANRSIIILAWDFNSQTPLSCEEKRGAPPALLGDFLNFLVKRRRGLNIYVLNWDYPMVYGTDREFPPMFGLGWKPRRRVHLRYDNTHPVASSHHQKVVVIDDAIAFSGGLDLTIRRWDTPAHLAQHPGRVDHHGVPYPPFHDIQLLVDGPAARALAELVRERWFHRTGQRIPLTPVDTDPWPGAVQPDITDVDVVIARTEPAYAGRPAVREIEALYLDSIATAQRHIYIESQDFTSRRIAAGLGERLQEAHGPEVIIVGPAECSGWLEEQTVGVLRNRFVQRLQARDRFGRLRFVYPVRHGVTPCPVFIHAKICIIDDMFVRVGSAIFGHR